MLNLTSKKTLDAKMRVKSDIFAGWEEEVDHQVNICIYILCFAWAVCVHTCITLRGLPHETILLAHSARICIHVHVEQTGARDVHALYRG